MQRRHVRIPVDAKVDLVYDSFASFISDYVSNVSRGGMFIATTQVRPPGTRLTFELRLRDDFPLIRGRGEVVWVRRDGSGDADRATGMAVRFLELDQQSAELIERMVEQHRREGGAPFAVEDAGSTSFLESPGHEPSESTAPAEGAAAVLESGSEGDVFAMPEEASATALPESDDRPVDVFARPPGEPEEVTPDVAPPASVREELPPLEPMLGEESAPPAEEIPLGFGYAEESTPPPASVTSPDELVADDDERVIDDVLRVRQRPRRRWPLVAGVVCLLVVVAGAVALWRQGVIALPLLGGGSATRAPAATAVVQRDVTPAPAAAAVEPVPPATGQEAVSSSAAGATASVVPTPPPAASTPVAVVPPNPATAVESVSWRREGAATVLRVVTNGRLERSRLREYRLESPPRQVVRIAGITAPYDDHPLEGEGPLLLRVRVGFHPEKKPPELHVVVDLADDGVRLDGLEVVGADVVLRFVHD